MNSTTEQRLFAFLLHPRSLADIRKHFPVLRFLPRPLVLWLVRLMPPLALGTVRGFIGKDGVPSLGYLIAIPIPAREMLEHRELARRHVLKALRTAHRKGATMVGLGGYTSVVTDGGRSVAGQVAGVHVTNGNALTAHIAYRGLCEVRDARELKAPVIAVVGATGSIGRAVSQMLANEGAFSRLYVIGRTPKHIEDLRQALASSFASERIEVATIERALPEADLVVLATSAQGALFDAALLKEHAILYDITQPKNTPRDLAERRPDVTLIDGGLIALPHGCSYDYPLGIPRTSIFACLGETILMSLSARDDDFCLGHVTMAHVEHIAQLAEAYGFRPNEVRT